MKSIEKDNNSNAEFGIVLEEKASSLTQGYTGDHFEGSGRHIRQY